MSHPVNDEILERLYDEVWEEYRKENNLTEDQLYTREQNSETGTLPEIEEEVMKRFSEIAQ